MVNIDGDLLPPSVLRQIGDKLYEKRKVAALEVEQIIKRLASVNDQQRIKAIIDKLIREYAFNNLNNTNHRKGALLCLAAATVGLGVPTEAHLRHIVPPVLAQFNDQDSRVRYYACEALYNIAKVARNSFIIFFSEVFDAMFRLCADSEANVQNAVQFLNNLIKDIVSESCEFSIDAFIPKLREYLKVVNPQKRQFLIDWITVLDSVPDLNTLQYLPELLNGLMNMLSDTNREIRVAAHRAIMEFLMEIHATPSVDFAALAPILVEKANSQDELMRQTALKWLKEFVSMASSKLIDQYPAILGAVLSNISHPSKEIQEVSREANAALLLLQPGSGINMREILGTVSLELRSEQEPTRLEALNWVHLLLHHNQQQVLGHLATLLPALLDSLSAPSEVVVRTALDVLAAIAACPEQFRPVLVNLLSRFRGPNGVILLQRGGGSSVIRRLSAHLGPQRVFTELATILYGEEDLGFASMLVQALNLILLTSPEVRDMRDMLRGAASQPAAADLFSALYPCWCHSTGALLSLCFLAQAYEHACDIIDTFATLPMGAEVLVQIDGLVRLLEAPAFTGLRLQLLRPSTHPALLRAMYGLLALLPQSTAFQTLHTRLSSIPTLALLQLDANFPRAPVDSKSVISSVDVRQPSKPWADFGKLLSTFVTVRSRHADYEEALGNGVPEQGLPVPISRTEPSLSSGLVDAASPAGVDELEASEASFQVQGSTDLGIAKTSNSSTRST